LSASFNQNWVKSRPLIVLLLCSAIPGLRADGGTPVRASSQLSAAISAGLPRFDQVPVATPHRIEPLDGIALPPFVVEGTRIPKISAPELLTKAGMEALLRKNFPGASFRGQDPTMNGHVPNYAALMYRDDIRLMHMAEFQQALDSLVIGGDVAGAKKLKAELQKTFTRAHDWRTEGMDKSVNHWRR
jgi:hypothetical protein